MPTWFIEALADPGIRTVRAALVFLFHVIAMAVVLFGMKAVQLLVELLWHGRRVMVLDRWDLDWLFQVIDVALIIVVGFFGVAEAIAAYRRPILSRVTHLVLDEFEEIG